MVLGIFDWVAEVGYSFTRALLKIVDFISISMNKISGIDTITVSGKETDLLTYLFQSNEIMYAFGVAAVLGFVLLVLFTVVQIVLSYAKEKNEEGPWQICKKALKNILILLLVPTFMYVFIVLTNAFVKAMYQATSQGNSDLAEFMFEIYAQDAVKSAYIDGMPEGTWNHSGSYMWDYMDLWSFDFLYSWIITAIVIYLLLKTCLMLVERCISLVFLYFAAPFVVATAVLDDGGKFKSWRDQVTLKFLTAHGAIIAINVYLLVVKLVISSKVTFFEDGYSLFGIGATPLNGFVKLVFILGGAFSLNQVQAIVGNLIQAGAGDRAVAENERATAKTGGLMGGVAKGVVTKPFGAVQSLQGFNRTKNEYGWGTAIGHAMGFKTDMDYHALSKSEKRWRDEASSQKNGNNPKNDNKNENQVQNALEGPKEQNNNNNNNDMNNNNNNQNSKSMSQGQNMVNNAIAGNGENK